MFFFSFIKCTNLSCVCELNFETKLSLPPIQSVIATIMSRAQRYRRSIDRVEIESMKVDQN